MNSRIKTIEELTFTDDGMFQAVLHEPTICAKLVERLLHINVNHVDYPELEKTIAPFFSTKGVRLDVYLKDQDKIIDVEMQSYPMDAIGRRSRYYEAMIDMDTLMKGEDYTKLKDSYILFICKNDPFRDEKGKPYDLPCYSFRNTCYENYAVNLNDNSLKVIYNASAYTKEEDPGIQKFLKYVFTDDPEGDDFTKQLSEIVRKLKDDEKFRSDYAAMNLHDRDIRVAAMKEGSQQKAIEAAVTAIDKYKVKPEDAAYDMGAPLEKVLEALNKTSK